MQGLCRPRDMLAVSDGDENPELIECHGFRRLKAASAKQIIDQIID
jgi:hypothetical protein